MFNDITCVILSGGKSKRMGVNKALLEVGGKTIIELIYNKVSQLFKNIIVISNEPHLYKFLNTKIYKDIYPGRGPISGIHSGLVNSTTNKNFIISCDIPLISIELIEYIVKYKTGKSITLPMTNEYMQTLCGIYSKDSIPFIDERMNRKDDGNENGKEKQRRFSLICLVMDVGAEIVDITTLPFYDDKVFINLNNKDDFDLVKKLIQKIN